MDHGVKTRLETLIRTMYRPSDGLSVVGYYKLIFGRMQTLATLM